MNQAVSWGNSIHREGQDCVGTFVLVVRTLFAFVGASKENRA